MGACDVLVWNCRGLGRSATKAYVRKMRTERKPGIVFLSETKADSGTLEWLRARMGCAGVLEAERVGQGGGLALFWDASLRVSLISRSERYIDVEVEKDGEEKWRFTGFYGYSEGSRKYLTWDLMRDLSTKSDLPWYICGDFNCIKAQEEKFNGPPYLNSVIDGFCTAIQDCNLYDIGWTGSFFTWNHGDVLERLDRGLATQDWINMFPNVEVEVLMSPTSDHLPLLTKLRPEVKSGKPRPFRFEEMWLADEGCELVVREAWKSVSFDGTMLAVMRKVEACTLALKKWSKETFGGVSRLLRVCERKFKSFRKNIKDPNVRAAEKLLMKELDKALEQEFLMWRQRAKQNWYRFGERNTRYFHAKATERKRHSMIKGLEEGGR